MITDDDIRFAAQMFRQCIVQRSKLSDLFRSESEQGLYGATECSFLVADAGEKIIHEAVTAIRSLTKALPEKRDAPKKPISRKRPLPHAL
ncbi:MAG: hypothetical protein K8T89_16115 [Planctomycetes bacterium]|nr:hypothetical protein [Planctomycetota bacterium]